MENIVEQVFDEFFWAINDDGLKVKIKYDPDKASRIVSDMSDMIKDKLRDLNLARYKYFVQVFMGEKKNQSIRIADRYLLNETYDCVASVTLQSDTFFCVALTYGIYQ